jgi:hypothetical protein
MSRKITLTHILLIDKGKSHASTYDDWTFLFRTSDGFATIAPLSQKATVLEVTPALLATSQSGDTSGNVVTRLPWTELLIDRS